MKDYLIIMLALLAAPWTLLREFLYPTKSQQSQLEEDRAVMCVAAVIGCVIYLIIGCISGAVYLAIHQYNTIP